MLVVIGTDRIGSCKSNKELKTVEIGNINHLKVSNKICFYVEVCQISTVKYQDKQIKPAKKWSMHRLTTV